MGDLLDLRIYKAIVMKTVLFCFKEEQYTKETKILETELYTYGNVT